MNPTTSLLGRLTRLPLSSLSVIVGLVIAATPANGFFFFQWPDNAYQCNVRAAERRPHGTACADEQTHRLTWSNAKAPFKAFVV